MFKEIYNISGYPLLFLQHGSFLQKIKQLLKVYGIIFASLFISASLILFVDFIVKTVLHFNGILNTDKESLQAIFHKYGRTKALMFACLLGPLFEELLFRLVLSLKKRDVALFLGALTFVLISGKLVSLQFSTLLLLKVLLSLSVFAACYFFLPQKPLNAAARYQKQLIIVSIISFGLIHITNYSHIQWAIIWLYPIYVLPQMIMGWGISYIRFKNGFVWGFLLHCLINSVSLLVFR